MNAKLPASPTAGPPGRDVAPPPAAAQLAARREAVAAAVADFQAGRDREAAFRVLHDAYYRPLLRFFTRKGMGADEVLDLTQETFLRIYTGLEGYRREARFETWLYRIATTTYLKRLRAGRAAMRAGEEISAEELPPESEALGTPGRQLGEVLAGERRRALAAAVAELPEQMRTALVLRIHQQLKYKEIATVMSISIQTVKAHLFQARHRLQQRLGDLAGEAEAEPG